jgi:transposase
MSNELSMAEQGAIAALLKQGWSKRRIARELGLHRDTVRRHARELARQTAAITAQSNPTDSKQATPVEVTTGSVEPLSRSKCEPYRQVIEQKAEAGLSAQRIYQDLTTEHGYQGAYEAVKRMVRRLCAGEELPFRRIECAPGAEAQVDFGVGAPVLDAAGKRRRTHVLRLGLSFSRKAYSEAVFQQTTDNLLACLENAFLYWGGVPRTLVIDNLRAAVTQPDWYDPELHPKISAFAQHYGTTVWPTKSYTPRHKGKIESGINYVKENALKGRVFPGLAEENAHLLHWENHVADLRIHGTTKKQVRQLFEIEKSALLPLPAARFPFFHEDQRIVHRDGHIEVAKAYYSVPPEYMGHTVWARWDSRLVRILNSRFEQIALHVRHELGRFSTDPQHLASRKIALIEQGATELLRRARLVGPQTGRWAEAVLNERAIEGVRVLVGLLGLVKQHSANAVEHACELACAHGAFRLRALRALLKTPHAQEQFEFMAEHPLIRNLNDYGTLVRVQFN